LRAPEPPHCKPSDVSRSAGHLRRGRPRRRDSGGQRRQPALVQSEAATWRALLAAVEDGRPSSASCSQDRWCSPRRSTA